MGIFQPNVKVGRRPAQRANQGALNKSTYIIIISWMDDSYGSIPLYI